MREFVFYALAAALLAFGTLTVTVRNLFHAALALLGTLLTTAALFVLLGAETVALGQVLVYVGGILIFVLYAIFLTTDMGGALAKPAPWQRVLGFAAALSLFAVIAGKAGHAAWSADAGSKARWALKGYASLQAVGERLLHPGAKGFLIPFEIVSVLLLVALVGSLAVVQGLKDGTGDGP